MKKFVSLLMTVVMFATMLTVFAVPASAAGILDVSEGCAKYISENGEYSRISVNGALVVEQDVEVKTEALYMYDSGALLLKPGVVIKTKSFYAHCDFLSIPAGVTIEVEDLVIVPERMVIEPGAVLKARTLSSTDGVTVNAGGTLIVSERDSFDTGYLELYGTLKSPEGVPYTTNTGYPHVVYHDGALVDVTFEDENVAQQFAAELSVAAGGNRVYKHTHTFNCPCVNCGAQPGSNTGSTLSEGNLTIIVGVAAAVIFGLGGFILGTKKKKKPAVAGGAESDE